MRIRIQEPPECVPVSRCETLVKNFRENFHENKSFRGNFGKNENFRENEIFAKTLYEQDWCKQQLPDSY
jgi:hypothetical protein